MDYQKKNKDLFFSNIASYIHNPNVKHYCLEAPFDPPELYPELPLINNTNKNNGIYIMVRELLKKLGMDKENIDTEMWNPFKDIVKPGYNVLIKPNLVTHRHYLGKDSLYGSIIHGSVIRPIIDYVYLALRGKGSITIADNPVEHSDFKSIMEFTGIQDMVDKLRYNNIQVRDLRPRILKEARNGEWYYESQIGDPLGYIDIDLKENSMFAEFDDNQYVHYYTLADRTVDHLNPKYKGLSITDEYHNSKMHKYVISKSILNADTVINIAKMKTHCKSGVSLTLKNMIGMVYEKHCMPHHRPGVPPEGDSFPFYPAAHYTFSRKLYINILRKYLQIHRFPGFRSIRNLMQKKGILIGKHIEHGNWKGNDTIWRTILDLNRIAVYADKNGKMQDSPQRNYLALIDGIISQQGEGPMSGEPIVTSILLGGYNPVIVDALAIKVMAIPSQLIKSIIKAKDINKWELLSDKDFNFSFPTNKVKNFNFILPHGWKLNHKHSL